MQLTKNAGFVFSEFIILCFTLWALIHWMIDALFTQKLHTPNHFTVYCILFAFRMDAESKCVCVCVSTICWARILRDKPRVRGVWKEQWFGLYVSKHHIIPCTVNIWNAKDQCAYIFGGNCRHYLCNERFMISNINAQAHTSKAFSVNNHFF